MKRLILILALFTCLTASQAAIVTRYFSTTAAGDGDGTSWANRAALFDGSNTWTDYIAAFDFSGSDSLLCYIGPGTYTCAETLAAAVFSVAAPNYTKPLILHGCDSSGNPLTPPDPDWVSAQPAWSDAALPVIATTGNIRTITLDGASVRLLKFTASGSIGSVISSANFVNWCHIVQSTSHANAAGIAYTVDCSNSVVTMSGTSYAYGVGCGGSSTRRNIRVVGNPSASGGDGFQAAFSPITLVGCTSVLNPGDGFDLVYAAAGARNNVIGCVAVSNSSSGIILGSSVSQTFYSAIVGCVIVGNGAYGIDLQAAGALVSGNRLRNNASDNFTSFDNIPDSFDNNVAAGSDSEFVNAAGGDYRIAASSALWGKGYGAGDEIPTPAAIAAAVWAREGRSLTE